jgi:signal transduction histidine kinase
MPIFDDYQIPALALIAALLLAFVYLHRRFRSLRTLLWLLALLCGGIQAAFFWVAGNCPQFVRATVPLTVAAEAFRLLSTALLIGSLSPLTFRLGRYRVLYVVPYIIPLILYASLYTGISQQPSTPQLSLLFAAYCLLAAIVAAAAFLWGLQKGPLPVWLNLAIVSAGALTCIPALIRGEVLWPLIIAESGAMVFAALLVVFTFRRFSPGVVLATAGFLAWAAPPLLLLHPMHWPVLVGIILVRVFILGKVLVATGLLVLVLEEEIDKNHAARQREHDVRMEIEVYARQGLTARSLEEFDRDSSQLCYMITEHSHFGSASIIVRSSTGVYMLAGYAGMDGATAGALDSLVQRLPGSCVDLGAEPIVEGGNTLDLDLSPWLAPGDDLERLHLTRVCIVPMFGPDNTAEGALLLSGNRIPVESLRADDLLPLEILAGRLQAARAQAMMLGKLLDSERSAGVGQLATNVAQQLNNPLTVILGYAALLEESIPEGSDRRAAEAIAAESRRMKSILDRLSRFSRLSNEKFSSFSVADLILDIEQLHRTDFLRHSIEFRAVVAANLPMIFGNAHQIRQALMHGMQFAIDGAMRVGLNQEKSIRIEAATPELEDGRIEILIAHSGHGFPHPDRAFDSLSSGFSSTEATGIGLSLCAAIVREHRGNISAINYQPTGAAILIDLPVS